MEKKFGYKSLYLGCIVRKGIEEYNAVMENYLEQKHGKNWRSLERQLFDSMMNHHRSHNYENK